MVIQSRMYLDIALQTFHPLVDKHQAKGQTEKDFFEFSLGEAIFSSKFTRTSYGVLFKQQIEINQE